MTTSTPIPTRQIGHDPTPPIAHDLGEVTANYPVGALTKGVKSDSSPTGEGGPDTLDFMLSQFRKDYIANADTEPNDLLREQQPDIQNPNKPKKQMRFVDLLTKMPPAILVVLSLGAGGVVALIIVGLAILALRFTG